MIITNLQENVNLQEKIYFPVYVSVRFLEINVLSIPSYCKLDVPKLSFHMEIVYLSLGFLT